MIFIRVEEDFMCEKCGAVVCGSGYTNHCSRCLWSKHVDIEPGDRAAACGGMMEPVAVEGSSPHYDIIHRCSRCGLKRRNKAASDDDLASILSIAEGNKLGNN